jgi:hypothetical protein
MIRTKQIVGWPTALAVGDINLPDVNLAGFAPPPLKRWVTHSVRQPLGLPALEIAKGHP